MPRVRGDIKDLRRYARSSTFEEKYPFFGRLLDGRTHELVHGQDFEVLPETLRAALKEWSKRNGVPLTIRTEGKNVLIQAAKPRAKARTTRRKGGSKR